MPGWLVVHVADVHVQDRHHAVLREAGAFLHAEAARRAAAARAAGREPLVVVAGDVLHRKTAMSAGEFSDAVWFLGGLAAAAPVALLPGNHDMDPRVAGGPDLLGPLAAEVGRMRGVEVWRGGVHRLLGLDFVAVPPDGPVPAVPPRAPGVPLCAVWHEDVAGARYQNGVTCHRGRLTGAWLDQFDAAFGGHVHLAQQLGRAGRAWFPSSLVQQDFGESEKGHGFLVWEIDPVERGAGGPYATAPPRVEFVEAPTRAKYLTLRVEPGRPLDVPDLAGALGVRLAVAAGCGEAEAARAVAAAERQRPVRVVREGGACREAALQARAALAEARAAPALDPGAPEKGRSPFDEFVAQRWPRLAGALAAEHARRLAGLAAPPPGAPGARWRPLVLSFSDFMCYGPGNVVDFRPLRGRLAGVVARNECGKSALLAALHFAAYGDGHVRHGAAGERARRGAAGYEVHLAYETDEGVGLISRTGRAAAAAQSQVFHAFAGRPEMGATARDTDRLIERRLGTLRDAMDTALALDWPGEAVHPALTATPAENRARLARVMRLDAFEEAAAMAETDRLVAARDAAAARSRCAGPAPDPVPLELALASARAAAEVAEAGRGAACARLEEAAAAGGAPPRPGAAERAAAAARWAASHGRRPQPQAGALVRLEMEAAAAAGRERDLAEPARLAAGLLRDLGEPRGSGGQAAPTGEELTRAVAAVRSAVGPTARGMRVLLEEAAAAGLGAPGAAWTAAGAAQRAQSEAETARILADRVSAAIAAAPAELLVPARRPDARDWASGWGPAGGAEERAAWALDRTGRVTLAGMAARVQGVVLLGLPVVGETRVAAAARVNRLVDREVAGEPIRAARSAAVRDLAEPDGRPAAALAALAVLVELAPGLGASAEARTAAAARARRLAIVAARADRLAQGARQVLLGQSGSGEADPGAARAVLAAAAAAQAERGRAVVLLEDARAEDAAAAADGEAVKAAAWTRLEAARADLSASTRKAAAARGAVEAAGAVLAVARAGAEARRAEEDRLAVSSTRLELLQAYCSAVGQRDGLPAALIARATRGFEEAANDALGALADFYVSVDAECGLRVVRERPVAGRPAPVSYSVQTVSNFQRLALGLAVRTALFPMASSPVPDALVMDEGFGALDAENLARLVAFLADEARSSYGLVLVVTHVEPVQLALETALAIERRDGQSFVRFAPDGLPAGPTARDVCLGLVAAAAAPAGAPVVAPGWGEPRPNGRIFCRACGIEMAEESFRRTHQASARHRARLAALGQNSACPRARRPGSPGNTA